ncbi:MAG: hypothetical protein KGL63_04845 [Betaproteobacteria bacterium]|nr:hypothetical protein [Betaproteobacteria bacterium]
MRFTGLSRAIPLFALSFSLDASAEPLKVGDWWLTVQASSSLVETFTSNGSNSTFGLICGASCTFYLDTHTQCDEGEAIPMLVNSQSGSTYTVAKCEILTRGPITRYVSAFPDKDIVTAISAGNVIGFAIPLVNGEFKVVRFSLNGAAAATEKAADFAERIRQNRGQYRDTIL